MPQLDQTEPRPVPVTALTLSDRLIALAQDAERAGLIGTAQRLVRLACSVFDEARKIRN
jgi:hypothetical protein